VRAPKMFENTCSCPISRSTDVKTFQLQRALSIDPYWGSDPEPVGGPKLTCAWPTLFFRLHHCFEPCNIITATVRLRADNWVSGSNKSTNVNGLRGSRASVVKHLTHDYVRSKHVAFKHTSFLCLYSAGLRALDMLL